MWRGSPIQWADPVPPLHRNVTASEWVAPYAYGRGSDCSLRFNPSAGGAFGPWGGAHGSPAPGQYPIRHVQACGGGGGACPRECGGWRSCSGRRPRGRASPAPCGRTWGTTGRVRPAASGTAVQWPARAVPRGSVAAHASSHTTGRCIAMRSSGHERRPTELTMALRVPTDALGKVRRVLTVLERNRRRGGGTGPCRTLFRRAALCVATLRVATCRGKCALAAVHKVAVVVPELARLLRISRQVACARKQNR